MGLGGPTFVQLGPGVGRRHRRRGRSPPSSRPSSRRSARDRSPAPWRPVVGRRHRLRRPTVSSSSRSFWTAGEPATDGMAARTWGWPSRWRRDAAPPSSHATAPLPAPAWRPPIARATRARRRGPARARGSAPSRTAAAGASGRLLGRGARRAGTLDLVLDVSALAHWLRIVRRAARRDQRREGSAGWPDRAGVCLAVPQAAPRRGRRAGRTGRRTHSGSSTAPEAISRSSGFLLSQLFVCAPATTTPSRVQATTTPSSSRRRCAPCRGPAGRGPPCRGRTGRSRSTGPGRRPRPSRACSPPPSGPGVARCPSAPSGPGRGSAGSTPTRRPRPRTRRRPTTAGARRRGCRRRRRGRPERASSSAGAAPRPRTTRSVSRVWPVSRTTCRRPPTSLSPVSREERTSRTPWRSWRSLSSRPSSAPRWRSRTSSPGTTSVTPRPSSRSDAAASAAIHPPPATIADGPCPPPRAADLHPRRCGRRTPTARRLRRAEAARHGPPSRAAAGRIGSTSHRPWPASGRRRRARPRGRPSGARCRPPRRRRPAASRASRRPPRRAGTPSSAAVARRAGAARPSRRRRRSA